MGVEVGVGGRGLAIRRSRFLLLLLLLLPRSLKEAAGLKVDLRGGGIRCFPVLRDLDLGRRL